MEKSIEEEKKEYDKEWHHAINLILNEPNHEGFFRLLDCEKKMIKDKLESLRFKADGGDNPVTYIKSIHQINYFKTTLDLIELIQKNKTRYCTDSYQIDADLQDLHDSYIAKYDGFVNNELNEDDEDDNKV